ncbi:MAG: endonuclease [Flavobacterium sp.]|uniref:endonuclease/exonuclease/phosphatase family protein n=1 Tax=Flavobacterium sp. TaxID=239 RepID=UPI001205AE5B|nr:endonuclease/exonuclease/phosphatase family protein [Flavobacterium sp.]RZJ66843.1 MAG: endonuclease [Flavobacterium sp.]
MSPTEIFLLVFSIVLVVASLMPLIKNEYWVFRVFDYPRLQKFTATLCCIGLLLFFYDSRQAFPMLLPSVMTANLLYLGYQIVPFTLFGKKQVLRATANSPEKSISIIIANVYQDNDNCVGCLDEVRRANPDIALFLETDSKWAEYLDELKDDFPYSVLVPLENTYGMLLYSKLELKDSEVKYLVESDIPSIHTTVLLRNGQPIQLYAVHPTPPVPKENPRSTERDKELLLVADLARNCKNPVVVIGDLNDVAWSYTTELFLKMSKLLDPRRGRGFYNSFHAHYWFMRFPLDHAFISEHLKLIEMRRLKNFDSDHFPIYISLQFDPKAAAQQEQELKPDAEDIEIANEKKAAV